MGKAWAAGLAAIFATLCFACSQFKVTGTMVYIMDDWGLGLSTVGLLMTLSSIPVMLVALPGGVVLQKLGSRRTLIGIVSLGIAFNVLGALAPSFFPLAIFRFFEGVCLGMITIVTPAIIAQSFPAEKRGLPMALFSLWVPAGMLCILNISNFVTPLYGWQANWWVVAALLVVALVVATVLVKEGPASDKMPEVTDEKAAEGSAQPENTQAKGLWLRGIKALGPWCLCIAFFVYSVGLGAYNTYFPTYLTQSFGIDSATANSITGISTIAMMVAGLACGVIMNRVPNKYHGLMLVGSMILYCLAMVTQFNLPSLSLAIPIMIFVGAASQLVAPLIYDVLPETVPPDLIPIGMSIVTFGCGMGTVLTTAICGVFVEAFGSWSSLVIPLGVCGVIGVAASVMVLRIQRKRG